MELTEIRPLLLVQHGRTLLKISTVYPTRCTAQVLYEKGGMPGRTTVREYTVEDVAAFREPTAGLLGRFRSSGGNA